MSQKAGMTVTRGFAASRQARILGFLRNPVRPENSITFQEAFLQRLCSLQERVPSLRRGWPHLRQKLSKPQREPSHLSL
jgi:hypothetical protein